MSDNRRALGNLEFYWMRNEKEDVLKKDLSPINTIENEAFYRSNLKTSTVIFVLKVGCKIEIKTNELC